MGHILSFLFWILIYYINLLFNLLSIYWSIFIITLKSIIYGAYSPQQRVYQTEYIERYVRCSNHFTFPYY